MAALGRKRTLVHAVDYSPTGTLRISLAPAVTLSAYHANAAWHFNRAFRPIAAVALEVSVTFIAPRIPQVVRVVWGVRNKPDCLASLSGSDVSADASYRLDAVFGAIASLIIHAPMMGQRANVRNGSKADTPFP